MATFARMLLLSVGILITITGAGALDFQYTSIGPGPCVHVTLEAILTLNLKDEQSTRSLSLNGSNVTSGSCKTDRTDLFVSTAQSHTIHFQFSKSADGSVSVSYKVTYKRQDTTDLILDSDDLPLMGADETYTCSSVDTILLHDDSGLNVGSFFISNVTLQVFGFRNGTFPENVRTCSIDNTSSTLHPGPRSEGEDLTDGVTEFSLRDEAVNVCVRLRGELEIQQQYQLQDGNTTIVKLAVPQTAFVSGFCDQEKSYLALRYKDGEANRAVIFYLRHSGSQTLLDSIETVIKLDSAKFPGAKLENVIVRSYGHFDEQLGSDTTFYGCQHEKQFLGTDFALLTRHLRFQSSTTGLTDGFSVTRSGCPEDVVQMSEISLFSVKEGNQTCLLLSAALRFSLPYVSRQNKTEQQLVNVPASSGITGNCNSTKQQEMTLNFYNNWKLRFVFVAAPRDESGSSSSIIGYTLDNITLSYEQSPLIFYNLDTTTKGSVKTVFSRSFNSPLKATSDGYYYCDSTMDMTFTDGVTLKVKDLRFQAFRRSESEEFSGDVSTCDSLSKSGRHYTVYVVVGLLTVAILAILVVVGMAVMKKRKRNTYQHMD